MGYPQDYVFKDMILPILFFFGRMLAVIFFTSIMRHNLPGEIMKDSADFCHKAQLPEKRRQLAVIVFPLLNQSFNAPQ
ncbi:hypothetical protein CKY10_06970 [Photorhabdus sp. HUG-39]|uniref:Uncharacterized protein n=1 Tax=Photorhabdus kayaii TaxID=230088 RepID=A0ABX0B0X2_9GAMM|nr:hypothetical protein [Photorhabdus bodei]MCC8466691.1 hypothetical protein [Photorhabdus bodei]NDL11520.1 hypothetical protein [Photorhabdus kayaii]NDL25153.1 hypothetical protein [Photorhabdus kayaii]RAX10586.1 hypothetical protein CKY10_06970 [Photorhabdus sp. HUG-39]